MSFIAIIIMNQMRSPVMYFAKLFFTDVDCKYAVAYCQARE